MSNATWTIEQVRQVLSLRQVAVIDDNVPHFDRVLEAAKRLTGKAFVRAAHPFAVEVHPEDLRFDTEPVGKPWEGKRLVCRWAPETREVEIVGGHEDGVLIEFRGTPHDSLYLDVNASSALLEVPHGPISAATKTLHLCCVGWREEARRWVYGVRA